MITSLSRLMMDRFIDMMCGDFTAIKEPGDSNSPQEVAETVAKLIYEYEKTIDPSGYKRRLSDAIDERRRDMKLMMLRICGAMVELGDVDSAKSTLEQYGWRVKDLEGERLRQKIEAEARRFEAEIKREKEGREERTEEEQPDPDEIRANYDKETAFIMTYFKMQIKLSEISAAVYANIVAQAMEEIRLKNQAARKYK